MRKELKPLPEGLRWVEVRDFNSESWRKLVLAFDAGDKVTGVRYACYGSEGLSSISLWYQMREIEQPVEKQWKSPLGRVYVPVKDDDNFCSICHGKLNEKGASGYACEDYHKPVKIPYTAETFPADVFWIRMAGKNEGCRLSISFVDIDRIKTISLEAKYNDVDNWEIAGTETDENGEIIWRPFYQLKEN